jgi:hypothetical protein
MDSIEKFEREMEMESTELIEHDYLMPGIDYSDEDNLDDGLQTAIESFCRKQGYSQKTINMLLDSIPARDAYYKMLEREGALKELMKEQP